MSGMRSRGKGKVGEREVAALIRASGFTEARRGVQYEGGSDSADVVGLNGCHVEVKRNETGPLTVYKWLDQATTESKKGETPVVFHRRNRHPWIVILSAEDFLSILHDAEHGVAHTGTAG